jgi:hypothetical protein
MISIQYNGYFSLKQWMMTDTKTCKHSLPECPLGLACMCSRSVLPPIQSCLRCHLSLQVRSLLDDIKKLNQSSDTHPDSLNLFWCRTENYFGVGRKIILVSDGKSLLESVSISERVNTDFVCAMWSPHITIDRL